MKLPIALICAACLAPLAAAQAKPTKLLRFPDIHRERVVFCYGGDLWSAPSNGGSALRLTAHEGLELFPKFSPDGKWIAFTGQYDGDEQVYVIPSEGGEPRQLTFYPSRGPLPPRWGYDNQVYGWTKDSQRVLFRSMRDGWALTDTRLYTVDLGGSQPRALPMPVSGGGDLSPDESRIVYSPLTRDFRTWKRYQGGWAQDLYIYELASAALTPVAHSVRTERDPMWIGPRIYFASDRDGTLNLYSYDTNGGAVEQLTRSTSWDVRWPSKGEDGEIVYEQNGELAVFDTRTNTDRKLSIHVPADLVAARSEEVDAADRIESSDIAPGGPRVVFAARGDVFSVPAEKGTTRNLTRSPGTHERAVRWSPDGASICYLSDASGEEELMLVPQDGSAPARVLGAGPKRRLNDPLWAPDSKTIAMSDCSGRVYTVDAASGAWKEIAKDPSGGVGDYSWAPDSRWLAFSLGDANGYRSIWIWGAEDAQLRRVTDELFNETEPVFDAEGKYLYYLTEREWTPQLNLLEWNFQPNRATEICALALRKDVGHPFPPQSDEVESKPAEAAKPAAESTPKDGAKAAEPVRIDFDGLAARVARVPLESDNYSNLSGNKDALFFVRSGGAYYGREGERPRTLLCFDLKERKASALAEGIGNYRMSPDGKKLLVSEGGGWSIFDASPKGKDSKKGVSISELRMLRDPRAEWRDIYYEVWRRYRDFFYVDNMHGYDWPALREQYAPWLEHVAHRSDLNYLIGELIAELNVGHAYISGGDWSRPKRVPVALFGGRVELEASSGRYRFAKIFAGHNEEERYRSPLTEIGVDVKLGDYLLAIDGEDLPGSANPYKLLRGKANRPVEFLVNDKPAPEGARKVLIRPLASENDLLYFDWVDANRKRVAELTGGRIAYVHMPDMGDHGIYEFHKWFYGQTRMAGLIFDDRNNGGGNVSQMAIERLRRVLLGTEYSRWSEFTGTYPQVVFHGPMVCLLDENSASDGDIFPWMFKAAGLGPLIGKRSWGGVVGITDHGPLIDGGSVNVPEFGHADASGQWAVEGHGVDPDIVVENDPASVIAGHDPQLERAVQEVLKKLGPDAGKLPPRPAAPVKTK